MKHIYREVYREARHIELELPADATLEEIRDAAYGHKSDEWESDDYEVLDTFVEDENGKEIRFFDNDRVREDVCRNCNENIVKECKDDPWFHTETGEERCEKSEDFAVPKHD